MIPVFACVLALLAPQEAEKAIRESVQGFFAAAKKGDAEAASKFWSEDSPEYRPFGEKAATAFLTPPEEHPSSVDVARVVVEGDFATVWIRFNGRWGNHPQYPDEKVNTWHVVFRRIAGTWKWWAQEPAALDLARALAAEPKDGLGKLLDHNKDLVGIRLFRTLVDVASDLGLAGRGDEGLKWVDVADEVAQRLGVEDFKTESLMTRGQVLLSGQRSREAAVPLREARDRSEKSTNVALQADTRMFLGISIVDWGNPADAIKELARSIELAGPINDVATLAMSECFTGTAHRKLGQYPEAYRWFEKSLARSRGVAGGSLEILALAEIGQARLEQGDYGAGFAPLVRALELSKSLQYPQFQGRVLYALGLLHGATGDLDKALEYLMDGLKIWHALGSDRMRGRFLTALGSVRTLGVDYAGAAVELDAALQCLQKAGDLAACAEVACSRGLLLILQGEYDAAQKQLQQGLKFCPENESPLLRLTLESCMGVALLGKRDWPASLELFKAALQPSRMDKSGLRLLCHAGIGRALLGRGGPGDLDAAVESYRKGVAAIEETRGELLEQSIQQTFFSQFAPVAFLLSEALLRQKKPTESFEAAEQAKARTLVEALVRPGAKLGKGMTAEERREEEAYEGRVGALMRRLDAAHGTDEREDLEAQLRQARSDAEEFRRRIFLARPDLKFNRGRFEPVTLAELQRSLFNASPGLGIVSYFVGPEEVLLFVLTKGTDAATLNVHRIPYVFATLQAAVVDFWGQCSSATGDPSKGARALYDALLKPAEADLAGVTHLVVVPDRMLHFLPFQALRDEKGRHLIEKWSVSFAPSVTALAKLKELSDRRKAETGSVPLLAVGAPVMPPGYSDLPHSKAEVEALAALFEVKPLTGAEAKESTVKEKLASARRIHIATHGKVNESTPMESFIVLGRDEREDGADGLLSARELADLNLHAELMVLSACETGLGQWRGGEGVIGLAWSIASAGIPTSLLSQWRVEDESTKNLMTAFYQGLSRPGTAGRSKAEALRAAQLKLLKDERWAHPYFWSPFVLMGDWR